MTHEKRYVRVPIFIDPASPNYCNQPSARYQGVELPPNEDGCEAFYYSETGQGHCGAFDHGLVQVDDDENDEYARHYRCKPCLESEVP